MRYKEHLEWFDLSKMDPDHPMYEKLKELNEKKIVHTFTVLEPGDPDYEESQTNYKVERMKEERRAYYQSLNESEN